MRSFLIILLVSISMHVNAQTIVWDEAFRVSDAASIDIKLIDDARQGCWTNLKEVREYAEEKLRMKGAIVVDLRNSYPLASNQQYRLDIGVVGNRLYKNGDGPCNGRVIVELRTIASINGIYHTALAGSYIGSGLFRNNVNQLTLDMVQSLMKELKE